MNQFQLKKEIETMKRQLIEVAFKTNSLIHHKVIEKSQELDELITKYHQLSDYK